MKIESIMIDNTFYTALKYTNYLTLIHFDLIFFYSYLFLQQILTPTEFIGLIQNAYN